MVVIIIIIIRRIIIIIVTASSFGSAETPRKDVFRVRIIKLTTRLQVKVKCAFQKPKFSSTK